MKTSNKKFLKKLDSLPVDKFFLKALYDNKYGYYSKKNPFGAKGDYITAPKISNLFCEIIAIWLISTWEKFGKPKSFNIVELGPGDGTLTKNLFKNNFRAEQIHHLIHSYGRNSPRMFPGPLGRFEAENCTVEFKNAETF